MQRWMSVLGPVTVFPPDFFLHQTRLQFLCVLKLMALTGLFDSVSCSHFTCSTSHFCSDVLRQMAPLGSFVFCVLTHMHAQGYFK
jgi:hypothetical protein